MLVAVKQNDTLVDVGKVQSIEALDCFLHTIFLIVQKLVPDYLSLYLHISTPPLDEVYPFSSIKS